MLASRLGQPAAANSILSFDTRGWSLRRCPPPSVAGCERCGRRERIRCGVAIAYERGVRPVRSGS